MTVNNRSSSCVNSHHCAANTRKVVSSNLSNRLHLGGTFVGVVVTEGVPASSIQSPNNDDATAMEEQSRLVIHAKSGGPPHDATYDVGRIAVRHSSSVRCKAHV